VPLVGFIIRIYHDARPSECQVPQCSYVQVNLVCMFVESKKSIAVNSWLVWQWGYGEIFPSDKWSFHPKSV